MYGLVNLGVKDLVCGQFGDDVWEQIKQEAGLEFDEFLRMGAYPDKLTYDLVGAASKVLELTPEEVLIAFGRYWVLFTAQEGYGELLELAGESLPEFLQNLDDLHTRVGMNFPDLQPPSFSCTDITEASLDLHYSSHREGLAPLVIGLLKGLGERFGTPVEVTQTAHRTEGADHDVFHVVYSS